MKTLASFLVFLFAPAPAFALCDQLGPCPGDSPVEIVGNGGKALPPDPQAEAARAAQRAKERADYVKKLQQSIK